MRWSFLLCVGLLTSCAKPAPTAETHDTKAEAERLKEFVLDAPPADIGTHLDVDFSGKLSLLGARGRADGRPETRDESQSDALLASAAEARRGLEAVHAHRGRFGRAPVEHRQRRAFARIALGFASLAAERLAARQGVRR